ncbi:Sodium-coupled monocarboxylate transporter 1 [Armadillidium vulgare]|nr:Sodium-coupled monocarboxylate transporter 1 [Armadillidium vulgare]
MDTIVEESEATFGIVNYIVFALVLIVSIGIGIYSSFKGKKSPEDFLMGNRDFGIVPVAMSLLTSFISAISLLEIRFNMVPFETKKGFNETQQDIQETYSNGIEMYLFIVGIVCGIWVAGTICLPVLYPLN